MKTHHCDLTIDEAMADPLIRIMMRADRVEPRQLESMLRTLASVTPSRHTREVPSIMMSGLASLKGASTPRGAFCPC